MNSKKAIVLFNLGGPNEFHEVRPFLFNLFADKNIIRLPYVLRMFVAYMISTFRYKKSGEEYKKMGGFSPILNNTKDLVRELENRVGDDYDFFISMRYNFPRSKELVRELAKKSYNEILLLPLYPQFSTTTTKSSIEEFMQYAKKYNLKTPVKSLCCYPTETSFVDSYVELLVESFQKIETKENIQVLFSAHGVPLKYITDGDPYEKQVHDSAQAIFEKFSQHESVKPHLSQIEKIVCFQSKVGPQKWLEPSTIQTIENAKDKRLLILPVAFTSEHLETLVELDMEYGDEAKEFGVLEYVRVPTVSIHPLFIQSLVDLIPTIGTEKSICKADCSKYCTKIAKAESKYNASLA